MNGTILTILPGSRPGKIAPHVPVLIKPIAGNPAKSCQASLEIGLPWRRDWMSWSWRRIPSRLALAMHHRTDAYNALAAADLAMSPQQKNRHGCKRALLGTPMIVVSRLASADGRDSQNPW